MISEDERTPKKKERTLAQDALALGRTTARHLHILKRKRKSTMKPIKPAPHFRAELLRKKTAARLAEQARREQGS